MYSLDPSIYEYLTSVVPKEDILLNEPMKNHITFRVGGEAKALLRINSVHQLQKLIPYLNSVNEPFYVIGNGSNILVGDQGYNGVILELGNQFSEIKIEDGVLVASAGALMSSIARVAYDNEYTGFEFASGIPGTIGGGVVMNAGAYGGELKDVVSEVTVLDAEGRLFTIPNEEMEFGYRTSIIKFRPYTVIEVRISLSKGTAADIKARMDELNSQRRLKQPLEYPSAGSTFKRPEGYFAGKLIMDAGLSGFTIGGAQVSQKHCGFVINKGDATAADVYEVIREVQKKVKEQFDVNLEPEVIFLGSF